MAVVGGGSENKEKTSTVRALIGCNRLDEILLIMTLSGGF